MAGKIYYNPADPAAFATERKLSRALKNAKRHTDSRGNIGEWLQQQDAYTLHKTVRKRFPRNPYIVTNIMDKWEYDLMDVQNVAKYNDGIRYLLTVIDVFSKFQRRSQIQTYCRYGIACERSNEALAHYEPGFVWDNTFA